MNKNEISQGYQAVQDLICNGLEQLDGSSQFVEDEWERNEGGGGKTRVISDGDLIEKGGVNFSEVFGPMSDAMKKQLQIEGNNFFACGVSIVLHPNNPHVPIIHKNIRYFEIDEGKRYWFGGGIDLTPHIIVKEKAQLFHKSLQSICDAYDTAFYPDFKERADNYFYIQHRDETRGIGGIFYDHLSEENCAVKKSDIFDFSEDLGQNFVSIYEQQTGDRDRSYSDAEKSWQLLRRGRYVEFNLVYDRGTKFGLHSGGRTESILMSLPVDARWLYNYQPIHTFEIETQDLLQKDIDWVNVL